ncbi:type 4a pilus biogenesis protein PilO [Undibacterium sp. Ji22W]|uniref:type 4a pilus biogenesis protein PilO n=1 Tax=Undibacterium sp. Ji22W TaxID=3413038 RepID=UPI003BF26CCC
MTKNPQQNSTSAVTPIPPEDPIATISFPEQTAVSPLLARITNTAIKQGLKTDTAEYLVSSDNKSSVQSTEVALTLKGDYPKLRQFFSDALSDTPTLAISKISLNRNSINETELNAQLRYRLYWSAK